MIERFRKAELSKLKLAFDKDYEMYEKSNFADRYDVRTRLFLPKWGTCVPTPFIVDKIVKWYKEAAAKNPKVTIYDVGAGTGILLVMLYLAGIPYDALVGVDLPRECLYEETPRYWKITEDSSFRGPEGRHPSDLVRRAIEFRVEQLPGERRFRCDSHWIGEQGHGELPAAADRHLCESPRMGRRGPHVALHRVSRLDSGHHHAQRGSPPAIHKLTDTHGAPAPSD